MMFALFRASLFCCSFCFESCFFALSFAFGDLSPILFSSRSQRTRRGRLRCYQPGRSVVARTCISAMVIDDLTPQLVVITVATGAVSERRAT